MMYIIKCI